MGQRSYGNLIVVGVQQSDLIDYLAVLSQQSQQGIKPHFLT